ncbi:MAG: FG-GAP-like repeat-containing protein [Phycisphaerae bacterium]
MKFFCIWCLAAAVAVAANAGAGRATQPPAANGDPAGVKRTVIRLDIPAPRGDDDSAGGMIVADADDDGRMDVLVTVKGHLTVCTTDGRRLWTKATDISVGGQSESQGLPGHHGPGVAAGDVNGDGKCEVVYLTRDGVLHVVEGAAGHEKATARPPAPRGAVRWEVAMIADFRGTGGDRDLLLQATNAEGYRTGRYLAAYTVDAVLAGRGPLWTTDRFVSCAHNAARLADLDGDGRDEVLGATILSPEGNLLARAAEFRGHIDSLFVAEVCPDRPGLEVVLLEEGSNHVQVIGVGGPIWREHFRKQEPQNAAVGRFKPGCDDVFIWCRSRYNEHQKPFVFDTAGRKVFDYAMDDVAPDGWTASGVEVIHTIDWTGRPQQLACAKERHTSGDVCLFEPLTGTFVVRLKEKADRLYVADVTGDWREEILVLAGSELHLYENAAPNPSPDHPRLWTDRNYRRLKQCHNYYSP